MKKFTFIAEFRGGTYISQFKGEDIDSVIKSWVLNLDSNLFSEKIILKIKDEIINNSNIHTPVLLNGLENVWDLSFVVNRSLLLITIVETI